MKVFFYFLRGPDLNGQDGEPRAIVHVTNYRYAWTAKFWRFMVVVRKL